MQRWIQRDRVRDTDTEVYRDTEVKAKVDTEVDTEIQR